MHNAVKSLFGVMVMMLGAVLITTFPNNASADGTVTMRQCIEQAIRYYPLSGYARAGTGIAENKFKQSRASLLPSVNVASSYGRDWGYDYSITNGGIAALQAVAQVDLFNPSSWLSTKALGMSYQTAKFDQQAVQSELAYTVKTTFIDAVTYTQRITILRENISSLGDYLALTRRLLSSGLVTENDVLRTQIDLDNSRAELQSFIVKRLNSLDTLSSLTGMPITQGAELQWKSVPFTVSSAPALNSVTFDGNPAMQAVRYEERSQRYNVSAEKMKHLPTLSLEADAGWLAEPQNTDFANYGGYSYLATLNFPIFEWGAVSYGVDAAEMGLQRVHYKQALLRNELTLSYVNAVKDLANAVERIELYQKDIGLSRKNFKYSEARYSGGGRISSFEVLLDRQLLIHTQMSLAAAESDFYKAIFKIEFLRGEIYGQEN